METNKIEEADSFEKILNEIIADEDNSEYNVGYYYEAYLNRMQSIADQLKRETLRDIETIAVKTKCDYASAINRYMRENDIKEEDITPNTSL